MSARLTLLVAAVVGLILLVAGPARAHEFRPGLLRLDQRGDDPGRWDLRLVTPAVSEAGVLGPGDLTPIVPAHCTLTPRSELAFTLDCGATGLVGPVGVAGLERHPVDVMLELRWADSTRFNAVLGPDTPTTSVGEAEARRASVFADYLALGVEHILAGLDHLLFVLGLVLLVRARVDRSPQARAGAGATARDPAIPALLATVTAFTLAHSVTLAASTLDLVRLPSAPVEAGIALSIVLLARELALGLPSSRSDEPALDTLTWRQPWLVAFGFGLLHGFGFAGALREIGLPPSQTPLALLAFNLGVEAGQLAVVAGLLLASSGIRRLGARLGLSPERERIARALPIWAMGALACAWTLERVLGFWA